MIKRIFRLSSNYYETLEVGVDASSLDIKKAYYKLAKKYHPDTSGGEMTEKFREINEAYAALIDPDKKQAYDSKLSAGFAHQSQDKETFDPKDSPYSKFWEKTHDKQYADVYENKRKEYLQKYREKILGQPSKLINKMRNDNSVNVSFGVMIYCSIFAVLLNVFGKNILTKRERDYSDQIQKEIDDVEVEVAKRKNFEVLKHN